MQIETTLPEIERTLLQIKIHLGHDRYSRQCSLDFRQVGLDFWQGGHDLQQVSLDLWQGRRK